MRRDSAAAIPYTAPLTWLTSGRPASPAGTVPKIWPAVLSPEVVQQVRRELDAVPLLADYRKLAIPAAVTPAALSGPLNRAAEHFGFAKVFWLAGVKRFIPGVADAIDWHRDEITFPGWQVRPHDRPPARPRTADVSFNVCLAGPDEYVGATFETRDGLELRLNAGDCIAFPSEIEHRVTRMESGRRYTAVFVGIDWRRLPSGGYPPAKVGTK
jgi:hypothetical protein